MASVFKSNGAARYTILYFDENGKRRKKTGATDKAVSERIARDIENRVALRREGIVDIKAESYRDHEARPLTDHQADWRDDLIHRGDTPKHVDLSTDRIRRSVAVMFGASPVEVDGKRMSRRQCEEARRLVAQRIAPARLSDLSAARIQSALARFRDTGRSLETCNHYRRAVRGFARWCRTEGRLQDDPLLSVAGFNAKEDRRHDRRTISHDELRRLIEAAEHGPVYQAMNGPARALCYRLALASGLRYSEIGSITPEAFDWTAPSVRVAACYTKNGETADLPLPSDLAADLRPYVATQKSADTHL
jgi:integrase